MEMQGKPLVRLKDVSVYAGIVSDGPDSGSVVLVLGGVPFGHPKLPDGDPILTSRIVAVGTEGDGIVETLNTRYLVGPDVQAHVVAHLTQTCTLGH